MKGPYFWSYNVYICRYPTHDAMDEVLGSEYEPNRSNLSRATEGHIRTYMHVLRITLRKHICSYLGAKDM